MWIWNGSIPSFGTETSRPLVEHKVIETESKNFVGGSLGVIVVPLPFLPLDSWNVHPVYETNVTVYQIVVFLENLAPVVQDNCHQAGDTVTKSSKGHFIILSSHLLRNARAHGETIGFYQHGPIAVLWMELIPLIRSSAITMSMDKAFCKSTDSSLGRNFAFREGKSTSRISIYSN